jgi:hypothetical protein
MGREMRTTFEGPVATGFLAWVVNARNQGLGLQYDELITSVTLFAISCITAFASFPSGRMVVNEKMSGKM